MKPEKWKMSMTGGWCKHCSTYNERSKKHCRACFTHREDDGVDEIPKFHASLPSEPSQGEIIQLRLLQRRLRPHKDTRIGDQP